MDTTANYNACHKLPNATQNTTYCNTIYLDNNSTTQIDKRVLDVMFGAFKDEYGNPHSRSHIFGWSAEGLVEHARINIANVIGADPNEIIFTSGATESNNIAIKGAARFYKSDKKDHIITISTEHKCVIESCRSLELEKFNVTMLKPESNGIVDLQKLTEAITNRTILISVMTVNNEIGVIQDIKEIGKIARDRGVLFHTDAAQAFGKIKMNVDDMNIDLMSISAHKIYGPKGIGALYVRKKPRVRLIPLFSGGGQERGIRSGTIPAPLAVGFGKAAEICITDFDSDFERIYKLSNLLYNDISSIPNTTLNGSFEKRYRGNLNFSFAFVEGESLIMAIKGIAVSSGSACTSSSLEPSYVLHSLGVKDELAHSSIRFGIGRFTTEQDIRDTVLVVQSAVSRLRDISPLWEMAQEGIDLDSIKWSQH